MKNFFIAQWSGAESYFEKNLKPTFYFCLALFGVLIILNVILFQSNPQMSEQYYNELLALFKDKELLKNTGINLWFGIFANNLLASGIIILTGVIPFLFLPIFSLASNAVIIGLLGAVYQINGVGWVPFFAGIIPHGILEIPALILGVTLGMHLCNKLIRSILRRSIKGELKQAVIACVRIYVLWMIPLFFVAAFIETFFTPVLFNIFF